MWFGENKMITKRVYLSVILYNNGNKQKRFNIFGYFYYGNNYIL